MRSTPALTPPIGSAAYARVMRRRRWLVASLSTATVLAVVLAMYRLLGADGLNGFEALMLVFVALTKPHLALSLWSVVAGLVLLVVYRDEAAAAVAPLNEPGVLPLTTKTAIVMPICEEDPGLVFRLLSTTVNLLDRTGEGDAFEVFLLSDTRDPKIAAEEARRFAAWRAQDLRPERLHYRRRDVNTDHKVGNLRAFGAAHGHRFDHMVVLDADSLMDGERIVRLARLMQANPRLGLIQTLVVGLPALSPFARFVQFGARQGLRPYIVGKTWWQGDEASYWGHNAIIRLAPYLEHCRVPRVPGPPPLGGEVLSHDHLEAVLMRRAGYGVHILPEEGGTFEDTPPTLPDFIKRELRWCFGNLQYLKLLHLPNLKAMGRVSLAMAALMYIGPFAWFGFIVTGALHLVALKLGLAGPNLLPPLDPASWGEVGFADFITLYLVLMAMIFAVKIVGAVDLLVRREARAAHGGMGRVLPGLGLELVFGFVMAPAIGFAITVFITALFFGHRLQWSAQRRDGRSLSVADAWHSLWPQTMAGAVLLALFAALAPAVVPWALPLVGALLLSVPFAVLTSRLSLGRRLAARGIAAVPEELHPTDAVRMAGILDGFPTPPATPRPVPAGGPIEADTYGEGVDGLRLTAAVRQSSQDA